MPTMFIHLPTDLYEQLEAQTRRAETTPEALTRALLQTALHAHEQPQPHTVREESCREQVVCVPSAMPCDGRSFPGVTLEEVRQALSQGAALSDIIQAQRGPKA